MPVTRARAKCNNPGTAAAPVAPAAAASKPSSRTRAKSKKAAAAAAAEDEVAATLPPPSPPRKTNYKSSTESGIVLESDRAGTSSSMYQRDSIPHIQTQSKKNANAGTGRQTRKAKKAAEAKENKEVAAATATTEAKANVETTEEINHSHGLVLQTFFNPKEGWHKKTNKILTEMDKVIDTKRKNAEKVFKSIRGGNGKKLDVEKTPLLRGLKSAASTRKKENNIGEKQPEKMIVEAEPEDNEPESEEAGGDSSAKKTRKILKTKGARDKERKAAAAATASIAKGEKRPRSPPGPFSGLNMVTPDLFDFGPKNQDEGLPAAKRLLADIMTPQKELELVTPPTKNNETYQVTPSHGKVLFSEQQQPSVSEPKNNETFQVIPLGKELVSEQQQEPSEASGSDSAFGSPCPKAADRDSLNHYHSIFNEGLNESLCAAAAAAGEMENAEAEPEPEPDIVTAVVDFGPRDQDEGLPAGEAKPVLADVMTPQKGLDPPKNETFQVPPGKELFSQQEEKEEEEQQKQKEQQQEEEQQQQGEEQQQQEEEQQQQEEEQPSGSVSGSASASGSASPRHADRDSLELYHSIFNDQIQDINESLFAAGELENAEAEDEEDEEVETEDDDENNPFDTAHVEGDFFPDDSVAGESNNYEISRLEDILDEQNNHRANKKIPMWARPGQALEGQLYLSNPRLIDAMDDPYDELSFPRPLAYFKLFPGAEPPRALLMPEVGNVQQKVAFYEEMIRV